MYFFRIVNFTIMNFKIIFYFLYGVEDGLPFVTSKFPQVIGFPKCGMIGKTFLKPLNVAMESVPANLRIRTISVDTWRRNKFFNRKSELKEAKNKLSRSNSKSQKEKFEVHRRCGGTATKIHSKQVEVWKHKTLASWSEIETNVQNREPLKPLLCCFLDSKKVEILGIHEWWWLTWLISIN
jgi:hypothetical protein